jgi:predicted extracellular nuclease
MGAGQSPEEQRIWQSGRDRKRLAQAKAIRRTYDDLISRNERHIAVIGDLNDTPDSAPLQPLMTSSLKDVSKLSLYEDDGHPGTYKNGTKSQKIDYILLSPALAQKATKAGVFRKGVWGGTHGDRWEIYPEMTKESHAASDHAAIWCDLDI